MQRSSSTTAKCNTSTAWKSTKTRWTSTKRAGPVSYTHLLVSGFNARQLTTYRRHDIGFVFQFYNLVGNLTALENVELAAQICRCV